MEFVDWVGVFWSTIVCVLVADVEGVNEGDGGGSRELDGDGREGEVVA